MLQAFAFFGGIAILGWVVVGLSEWSDAADRKWKRIQACEDGVSAIRKEIAYIMGAYSRYSERMMRIEEELFGSGGPEPEITWKLSKPKKRKAAK